MNWIGGGLSRSRYAKDSLSAKQKSYFANARGKLRYGPPPPPEMQFFEFGEWKPVPKAADVSLSDHGRQHSQSSPQMTLDEFETIRPLVRRLENMKPRQVHKRKRTPLQPSNSQTSQPRISKTQISEPIVIGSSPSAESDFSARSPTPKPRSPRKSSPDPPTSPSIQEKRRRLLEMDDWVGIHRTASKPVKMTFTDPKDRDMIGKRRRVSKMNHRGAFDAGRPERRPPQQPSLLERYNEDQHYSVGGVSVRIGSAADRSERECVGRRSTFQPVQTGILSEEMLLEEAEANASPLQRPLPRVHNIQTPQLMPRPRLSDHGYHEVLTPSAFMDESSQTLLDDESSRALLESRLSDESEEIRLATQQVPVIGRAERKGGTQEPEDEILSNDYQPVQEEPRCRLVFDDMPRPRARGSGSRGLNPITPEFARPGLETHVAPQVTHATAANQNAIHTHEASLLRRSVADNLPINTPPSGEAASHILTEFQNNVSSNAKLEEAIELRLNAMEQRYARQTGSPFTAKPQPVLHGIDQLHSAAKQGVQHPDQYRTTLEEENAWTAFMNVGSSEDTIEPAAQRHETNTVSEQQEGHNSSTFANRETLTSLPPDMKKQESRQAIEDEEYAWQKFVFGDIDIMDNTIDSDISQIEVPPQASSSQERPALTQPSLIAEIATSPLKQNPHLSDGTFARLTTTSIANPSPTQYSTTHPSPSSYFATSTGHRITSANASPTAHSVDSIPQTRASSPSQDLYSTPAQLPAGMRQPRPIPTSSMIVEVAPPSLSKSSLLRPSQTAISSDELAWSPERLLAVSRRHPVPGPEPAAVLKSTLPLPAKTHVLQKNEREKEKVVFKKPLRYVGEHSSDPPEPVVLGGRLLRSGRVLGGDRSARRGGKGGGKGRLGRMEDEQGDGDDIIDD